LTKLIAKKHAAASLDDPESLTRHDIPAHIVATFFANFLLDNIDLVRQLEDEFRDLQHVPLDPILSELEWTAQSWSG
jgi:hypothetical protein